MARAILSALDHAGHSVDLASHLRSFDKQGDPETQQRLIAQAHAEAARLCAAPEAQAWEGWITYHNYYKAPDLIGPVVCAELDVPYILIEATRARKRLSGPWSTFAALAEQASDAAQTILYFTEHDAGALFDYARQGQRLQHMPPFLARETVPPESTRSGTLLSVAMMRPGDKLASYTLIAETLALLEDVDWQLEVAGDGPARAEVTALLAPFGDRVRFLGALDPDALAKIYGSASCLFWPGVNEAFGMTYLEAQAAGLAVVAQDRPGVRDVVHSPLSDVSGGPKAMADRLASLIANAAMCHREGSGNRQKIKEHHLLSAAASQLDQTLRAA